MTRNLSQMLHDLNHHRLRHLSSRLSFRIFRFETSLTSISRFSRNVPHLPWHSTPSRCRSGGYTFACSAPTSSSLRLRSTFSDTLFSHRSTILSRFTAYHTCSVPRSSPAYRNDALFFFPRFTFTSPPAPRVGLSLPRSVAIPNLPILIYIRAIAYRLRPYTSRR